MTAIDRRRLAHLGLAAVTVLAIGLAIWLVRSIGWRDVLVATRQIGLGGLALVCLASLAMFGLLGQAWRVASGEPWRRTAIFAAARLIREAVSDFLPFSQIGGLAAGARVLRVSGLPPARLYASMVIDQATEIASQFVFTLAGIALAASVLLGEAGEAIRPMLIAGIVALSAAMLAFQLGQRRFLRFSAMLARRVLPNAADMLDEVDGELGRLYGRRWRIVASFAWNLAAWLASAGIGWLILMLIGHRLTIWQLISIESIVAAVRSIAFLVPGAIGFQEAAYVLVGPLLGLAAGPALALSLAKRARDIVMAVLAASAWQAIEIGAWRARRSAPVPGGGHP